MEIKHEHIRDAVTAWEKFPIRPSMKAGGCKAIASGISDAYFSLGLQKPKLYDDSHPEALKRNIQKIYRWLKSDTPASKAKIRQLIPAIREAMPSVLWASLTAANSIEYRATQALKEHQTAIEAALLHSPLAVFERACDEAERSLRELRQAYSALH